MAEVRAEMTSYVVLTRLSALEEKRIQSLFYTAVRNDIMWLDDVCRGIC